LARDGALLLVHRGRQDGVVELVGLLFRSLKICSKPRPKLSAGF
jgi:hypothetical protein